MEEATLAASAPRSHATFSDKSTEHTGTCRTDTSSEQAANTSDDEAKFRLELLAPWKNVNDREQDPSFAGSELRWQPAQAGDPSSA
eukprot:CAMPEP_0194536778 /NCGR_PEP_ID=MMETSP0253-20130528/75815_1 /TAXON_ID=2966 /ORGANISM="Noctiluca scintillans" /LENGTH=85 /DNA_ID=CAMNT_0039382735 /DNA_START=399 /DNA_END=657 /DNA_ORIENTATION=+